MSESSTLTRCPHCETRFRVTGEQLGIAQGKVRCGHCLQVFNANDHRESPADSRSPGAGSTSRDPLPDEDFIFEDDPEEDAAAGNYAGQKNTFSEDELSDSFLAFDNHSGNNFNETTEIEDEPIDESWAEAILANSKSANSKSGQYQPGNEQPKDAQPRETQSNSPQPEDKATREDLDSTRSSFHGDDELTQAGTSSSSSESDERPGADQGTSRNSTTDDDLFFTSDAGHEPSSKTHRPSPAGQAQMMDENSGMEEGPRISDSTNAGTGSPYDNLRVDPVTARYDRSSGSNGGLGRIIWGVGLVALIALLVAQVTYFQVDRLSSIPELRPYYEKGCDLIGCELPPLVAVDRIDSQKLVVRTHPEQRNMLVVDAVMVNRAEFAQPFPNIGLTFSNLNEDVVAQSLFEPSEYVAGEAKNLETMPSETPIRISITIRDPGRDAVNYNIAFIAR